MTHSGSTHSPVTQPSSVGEAGLVRMPDNVRTLSPRPIRWGEGQGEGQAKSCVLFAVSIELPLKHPGLPRPKTGSQHQRFSGELDRHTRPPTLDVD